MNDRAKRIVQIVLFILSVFLIAFVMYLMFFRSEKEPTTLEEAVAPTEQDTGALTPSKEGTASVPSQETIKEEGLPEAAEVADGGVTKTIALTTAAVENPTLSTDGKQMNFYSKEDGKFYTVGPDGNVVKLSDQAFPNVEDVTWNRNAQKAVLEFPDGSNVVYDFENEKQVTLPKHWEDFDFAPTSDELIAKNIALDPGNRWLIISNENGSNVVPFQALGENADKVEVSWSPNDQVVAFADTSAQVGEAQSSFDRRVIYPVGKNHENFKGLVVEGHGFSPLWSPGGKMLLYSVYGEYSQNKPLLWTVSATASTMGENRHSLSLNTWAEKCTWSSETILYCAVPRSLPDNAGIQPSLYANTPDALYRVNLDSGENSLVAIPNEDQTMKNLSVSKDGSLLYYTDASTGQLKLIRLK